MYGYIGMKLNLQPALRPVVPTGGENLCPKTPKNVDSGVWQKALEIKSLSNRKTAETAMYTNS